MSWSFLSLLFAANGSFLKTSYLISAHVFARTISPHVKGLILAPDTFSCTGVVLVFEIDKL